MSVLRTYSRFGIQRITSSVHKRCYTDSTKSTDSNLPTNTDSTKSTDSNLPTKTSKLDRVPKAGKLMIKSLNTVLRSSFKGADLVRIDCC